MIAEFLTEELAKVLVTILYGVICAIVYDMLRIIRRVLPHGIVAVSVEDILYWMLMSVCTFVMLIKINDGGIRFYFLIGALLGAVLYSFTISKCVVAAGTVIFRKIPVHILKKLSESIKIRNTKIKRSRNGKKRKEI